MGRKAERDILLLGLSQQRIQSKGRKHRKLVIQIQYVEFELVWDARVKETDNVAASLTTKDHGQRR